MHINQVNVYTVRIYIKNGKNMSKLIIMTLDFPSREEGESFKTVTERIKTAYCFVNQRHLTKMIIRTKYKRGFVCKRDRKK